MSILIGFCRFGTGRPDRRSLYELTGLQWGNPGDVKPVGGGISELRINDGPGYRVYYKKTGSEMVLLLCGGDKSSQEEDIERAKARL